MFVGLTPRLHSVHLCMDRDKPLTPALKDMGSGELSEVVALRAQRRTVVRTSLLDWYWLQGQILTINGQNYVDSYNELGTSSLTVAPHNVDSFHRKKMSSPVRGCLRCD